MEKQEAIRSDIAVFPELFSGVLTFEEFVMQEPIPLTTIHEAIFEFLCGKKDVAVFGAHAVNAYVSEPRMTQDIDLVSPNAKTISRELRDYLSGRFHIALRIREVSSRRGYRLYQIRKNGNRHLAVLRIVETLPTIRHIGKIQVIAPADLIAGKVISYYQRRGKPKSGTDWRDLAMLLLVFPELKCDPGPITEKLQAAGVGPDILNTWRELADQKIQPEDENDDF